MWFVHVCSTATLLLCEGCGTSPAVTPLPPADATAEQVKALLARINDEPDPLHIDYTPAVRKLIEIGEPALLPTLELMLSDDRPTRMRAQRVIEGVTLVQHGFVFGQGWKKAGGEEQWRKFWSERGDLDYRASPEKRAASVALWKKWLASRAKG